MAIKTPWETPPQPIEAIEVAPKVLWLRMPLPMALDHVNVYALDDGDGWTIVDTGLCTQKTKQMWRDIMDGPLHAKPIKRLIVTHHHPDHVGLAGWFQTEFGVSLVMTRTSWLMARMLCLDIQKLPPDETLLFWKRAGMRRDIYEARKNGKPFNFADAVAHMPLGYQRIIEGDEIVIGGRKWTVHIGHGHAPEHATFWSQEDDLILAGDQIISSISPNLGVYATEPDADPVGDWIETCQRFLPMANDKQLVLSGHKLPFYGVRFRLKQLIENHESALSRLINALDKPTTADGCFDTIFKRKIDEGEYGLALVEAVAHVNHLYKKGLVSRSVDDDGAYVFERI